MRIVPSPAAISLLSLDAPRQASAVRPGQFAMVRILGRSDVLLRRPMSIFNVMAVSGHRGKSRPGQAPRIMQLLYKTVGRGTRMIAELKKGDKVGLLAPLGHGFFEEEYLPRAREADEILQVAGGIGIAALLLPAKRLAELGFKQRLFFGARTKADLVGTAEFKPLVRATLLATENGSAGYHGYVTRPLEEYLAGTRQQEVSADGLRSWTHAACHRGTCQKFPPSLPGLDGKSHGLRARGVPGLLHTG